MTARDHARRQQTHRWHGRQGYYRMRSRYRYDDFDLRVQSAALRKIFMRITGQPLDQPCERSLEHWRRIARIIKPGHNKRKWYAWVRRDDYVFYALAWPAQDGQLKIIDTTR